MISSFINKKNYVPISQAKHYGFVLPVMFHKQLWQEYCINNACLHDDFLCDVLSIYASHLLENTSRVEIEFYVEQKTESKQVKLQSFLKFDRAINPVLLVNCIH